MADSSCPVFLPFIPSKPLLHRMGTDNLSPLQMIFLEKSYLTPDASMTSMHTQKKAFLDHQMYQSSNWPLLRHIGRRWRATKQTFILATMSQIITFMISSSNHKKSTQASSNWTQTHLQNQLVRALSPLIASWICSGHFCFTRTHNLLLVISTRDHAAPL